MQWTGGIGQYGDVRALGQRLLEEFQPLAGEPVTKVAQARDVPPRVRQAGDESFRYRIIGGGRHHDWDRVGGLLGRADGGAAPGHNQVHLELDQLGRQVAETFLTSLGIAVLNDKVLALDVAEIAQPLPESLQTRIGVKGGRAGTEPTDPVHFRRLLRVGAEGCQEEAKDEHDGEYKSLHLITSSAWKSMLGGIVIPSAWAVLRLITNSNFVGCSTGRSAGLAPFRILSTKTAARRHPQLGSDSFGP